MVMRKIVYIFLATILLLPGVAQAEGILFGGHGGIHIGGLYFNPTGINDFLEQGNVDELPSVLPTIGGGGQAIIFGGILIGARGGAVQYHLGGDDISVDASSGYGFFDLGYAFVNTDRWLVGTVAGAGGYSFRLEFDGTLNKLDLEQYSELYNPRSPDKVVEDKISMTTGGAIGHVGLVAYHEFRFTEGSGFGMFLVGLSGGAIFEISRRGWEIDGDDVHDDPEFTPNGGYLQMELHFGGGTQGKMRDFDIYSDPIQPRQPVEAPPQIPEEPAPEVVDPLEEPVATPTPR
jgi:hypothetical protein